ncbi:MAG: HAD-IIB family hydrolase [Deltaproteobacteria bacterium]|nr:MAG: HAD-IIB family hydrolase [Deltaproteobacteria bacterium]
MAERLRRTRSPIIIFTDLDGTLLDSQTYDFTPALPALKRIHSLQIALILVSSKTRAEIEVLRKKLSLDSPFISENGGGIFFPRTFTLPKDIAWQRIGGYKTILSGRPIKEVLGRISELKKEFRFKGFSEMSGKEIAAITDLELEEAILASRREFDEPIVLEYSGDDGEIFCRKAAELGLECVAGGRFIHLYIGGNKGRAVEMVLNIYRQLKGPVFSIALGDSPNDIPMLEVVDKAVVMLGKGGVSIKGLVHPDLIRAEGDGPKVWNRVVLDILEDLSP